MLIAVLLILLSLFFLWLWKLKCCVSKCNLLKEIVFWFGLNILFFATFLFTAGLSGGCQFILFRNITVLAVVTLLFGLLGAYYLKKCP